MNNPVTINDSMTLEEKLEAIDLALANNQFMPIHVDNDYQAPVDPATALMCQGGCQ